MIPRNHQLSRHGDLAKYGLESTASRAAYLRGLAFVDDYTNELQEGRLTPRLYKLRAASAARLRCYDQARWAVGATFARQCGHEHSTKRRRGLATKSANDLAGNEQLRISIRERLLDLFELARRTRTHTVGEQTYDSRQLAIAATSRYVRRMRASDFPDHEIWRILGISTREFWAATNSAPAPTLYSSGTPRYSVIDQVEYSHKNSKGVTYYLHSTEITLRGEENPRQIYFFAKVEKNAHGQPVALPSDREVKENPRNGFLTVVKKR